MATVPEHLQDEEERIAQELGDDDQGDAGADVDENTGDVDEPELDAGDEEGDEGGDDEGGDDELHPDEKAIEAEQDAQAQLKKVSQTGDRYIKRMVELLGPDLGGYHSCTLCDGFPPGLVIVEMIDDERRNQVKRQMGIETFDQLEPDESRFRMCEVCNGRGRVKTGSVKPGQEAQDCGACQGHGFRRVNTPTAGPDQPPAPAAGQVVELLVPPLEEGAPTDLPPFDNFGTPSWHEDYGKQPDFRTVPVSHWAGNLPAST